MSKLDRIPTDEPQGLLIDDFNRAVVAIENQSLLSPGMPWLPSPEELESSVREGLERQIADVFSVPHALIVSPTIASMIYVTFTINPFEGERSFQTELSELERKAALEPQTSFDMDLEDCEWAASEFELEQLDYEADSDMPPMTDDSFEWKLWALDHGHDEG